LKNLRARHWAAGQMLGIAAVLRDVTQRFEEIRALRRRLMAQSGGGA
jgi:hypothetical protein